MRTSILGAVAVFSSAAFGQSSRGLRLTSVQETTSNGTGMFEQLYTHPATQATTTTEILRGRIRLEITDGVMTGITAGQYTLQDTLDFLIIDPATRTFSRLNYQAMQAGLSSVTVRTDSLTATMDSAEVMDSVTGTRAMRYDFRFSQKMLASVNSSSLPAGLTVPDTRTTTIFTYEYWFPVGANDLPTVNRPPSASNSELAAKMREMFALLPRKRPTRSVIISRTEGDGGMGERRTTMRTTAFDSVAMDEARFVLPAGYTERTFMPGSAPADSAWLARWRMPPA